nr:FAD-dependent oxidoreductase [Thermodesulfobacterium hydrogeniphilum]
MVETGRSPNIEILTLTDIEKVEKEEDGYRVKVKIKPRYIDPNKCTACGECMKYCPTLAIDTYNVGLTFTRAARIDFPQAIPTCYYIDEASCLYLNHETCRICTNVCGPKAIDFSQKPEIKDLEVGAIVLTIGFSDVPESVLKKYGYGKYEDVLTSMEIERLMCVSGPTQGEIIRPSDFKHPKRIAYIQCIGSRNLTCDRPYCSSVCCMYAIKEASVLKEHDPDLDITLFYMDIRTQGKGFDAAFNNAVKKYGFKIIRGRPAKVDKVGDKLVLSYVTEEGEYKRDFYDMVVLSTGLSPPEDAEKIAEIFGIDLNEYRFVATKSIAPIQTSQPGIYVAGAFQGPKDIPESVTQASAAAAQVSEILKEARFSATIKKEYPPEEKELIKEEPRIGVFICHCGVNIAGVVKVEEVRNYIEKFPNVVLAETVLYACAQDFLEELKKKIKEYKLNRIVIAACTPRTHEPLFQDTLREAGLNLGLFEMANIRDQCAWVHSDNPDKATEKAKDLVRMALAKVQKLEPLNIHTVKVTPSALVIGGGVAGITAALSIAEQGYEVYLVEKENELGGNLKRIKYLITGEDPKVFLKELIEKVNNHPKIKVYLNTKVEKISGYVGNFTTVLKNEEKEKTVNHGVIIAATGAKEYIPSKYPYDGKKVITQLDLEKKLIEDKSFKKIKKVVMIQCAGSRGEELSYCSKVCCQQALKNALKIKEMSSNTEVYILYQDIRAYGFYEKYYLEARKRGIKFIRYLNNKRPMVEKKGRGVVVKVYDPIIGEEIEIKPDLVVLSVGIKFPEENEIVNMLKLPTTQEGFLMEAHVKLRPVETTSDGVFICGLAHSPQPLPEVLAQVKAAAAKACILLAKGVVETTPYIASINEKKCIGCGICAELCPFSAIEMVKVEKRRKAKVITASCKGCGVCASHCPVFAIDVGGFSTEAVLSQVQAFKGWELLENQTKKNRNGRKENRKLKEE